MKLKKVRTKVVLKREWTAKANSEKRIEIIIEAELYKYSWWKNAYIWYNEGKKGFFRDIQEHVLIVPRDKFLYAVDLEVLKE